MEPDTAIGNYILERRIAAGGMGEVWRARHRSLDRPFALKFIRSELLGQRSARDAFQREVRSLSRLHAPQTLQLVDTGFFGDAPYMVTEFLEGEDLKTHLAREGPLALVDAVHVGVEVLKSLTEAHAVGLVHRDLKPGNVFMQRLAGGAQWAVKVLDFGIAKLLKTEGDEDEDTVWPGARMKGSPRYMAPEQIRGEGVGPAADLYSFGALFYRITTGVPVFPGDRAGVLVAHLERRPEALSHRAPLIDVPPALDEVLLECLAKDPAARPASAAALGERLEAIARSLAGRAQSFQLDASVTLEAAPPPWAEGASEGGGESVGRAPPVDGADDDQLALGSQTSARVALLLSAVPAAAPAPGPVVPHSPPAHIGPMAGAPVAEVRVRVRPVDEPVGPEPPGASPAAHPLFAHAPPHGPAAGASGDGGVAFVQGTPEPVASAAGPTTAPAQLEVGDLELELESELGAGAGGTGPVQGAVAGQREVGIFRSSGAVIAPRSVPSSAPRPRRGTARGWMALTAVLMVLFVAWLGRRHLAAVAGVDEESLLGARFTPARQGPAPVVSAPRSGGPRARLGPLPAGQGVDGGPSDAAVDRRLQVAVRVEPVPARFVRVEGEKVLCEQVRRCLVPIDVDVRVEADGYRPSVLSGDDLYDRRGHGWGVRLQPR